MCSTVVSISQHRVSHLPTWKKKSSTSEGNRWSFPFDLRHFFSECIKIMPSKKHTSSTNTSETETFTFSEDFDFTFTIPMFQRKKRINRPLMQEWGRKRFDHLRKKKKGPHYRYEKLCKRARDHYIKERCKRDRPSKKKYQGHIWQQIMASTRFKLHRKRNWYANQGEVRLKVETILI